MRIPIYQIDAFAPAPFTGNPAAVCPLEAWLPEEVMQAIAAENNLSETAFLVSAGEGWEIRWFTPRIEIDLCGHATLASGYAVFQYLDPGREEAVFESRSGRLRVVREGELLALDFPSRPPEPAPIPEGLERGLSRRPLEVATSQRDLLALFESEEDVVALEPDFRALAELEAFGFIATAPGEEVDFVSRFFAPKGGIDEDPVTGSAHCVLTPYWAGRLGKSTLRARQVSRRGGDLVCTEMGERVKIAGEARVYLEGEIIV